MRIVLVLGAGAVGSLFGARLSRAGARVVLVGRPEHVAAVRSGGLTVEGIEPGTFRVEASTAIPTGLRPDMVLVTVKSFDLVAAVGGLARATPPGPTALLGNGLGIEDRAAGGLREGGWERPERWLVRAVHTVPATLLGPGRVRASGSGEVVLPDAASAGPAGDVAGGLAEMLSGAGLRVRRSDRFALEVWRKAVVNAAINPVTAVRRVPNGALASGPARVEAERLLVEAVDVAQRCGVDLTVERARADLDRVVRSTSQNRSSMLQDVERGRPTELDVISGEILRRGEALGLPLPATREAVRNVEDAVRAAGRTAQP